MRLRHLLLVLAVWAAGAGLSGCSAGGRTGPPVDRLAEARAALPDSIRSAKVITAGTDPTFEPMTFMDNGAFAGLDVDLGNALAQRLGLTVRWTSVPFGQLLDQVGAHQIDMSMSSMFDRATRQQKADFVDYLNAGTSIVVRSGTGDIGGLGGLCGRRVAVQPDTVYVDMATTQRQQCGARGLTIVLTATPSPAVVGNQADAALNDYPIAVTEVAKTPGLEISGPQIEALPYGIGVAKDRKPLLKALQRALYQLTKDGTYDKLLAKWNVKEGALRTTAINGGV
jgi:polar amino acid transport system substrate-binding protein